LVWQEIQVGIGKGVDAGDQVWMARYVLGRVAEQHGLAVSYEPKLAAEFNGSGMHTNVSSDDTRAPGGLAFITEAMPQFEAAHAEHMRAYGEGNQGRMTGAHETASYDRFSFGVADRGASVRIPRQTAAAGCGYFEDRRPAANADPYDVIRCVAAALYPAA
jgi:glutamine synthetase